MRRLTYKHTLAASYIGYITQAIVNNLPPLLFITFQTNFGLNLVQLTSLITLNFGVQLIVDAASIFFIDKIGYRAAAVIAHIFCVIGMMGMGLLPIILPAPYIGLLIAVVINAVGGGLLEVTISPIVEALPTDEKVASMSLLYSFYCWGFVLVVLLSTIFFKVVGIENWMWLCILWALVPFFNTFLFARAPVRPLIEEGDTALPLRKLFTSKIFLLLMVAIVCAGASEQAMSQWASLFTESGLGISKTMGDLLGPCVFAVLMGFARLLLGTGKISIRVEKVLLASGELSVFSYLLTVFAPSPAVSLIGCGLCGLSVGCMWPATFSLTAKAIPKGGTAMFALFALAGDMGCVSGPALVGLISDAYENGRFFIFSFSANGALKSGLLCAIIFPFLLFGVVLRYRLIAAHPVKKH